MGYLRNQNGVSVIFALISIALLSIILYSVLTTFNVSAKHTLTTNTMADVDSLISEVKNVLSNESICTARLSEQSALVGTELVLSNYIKKDSKIGTNLKIESFALVENTLSFDPYNTGKLHDGKLLIKFVTTRPIFGGSNFTREFHLIFEENAGAISRCYTRIPEVGLCSEMQGGQKYFGAKQGACTMVTQEDCRRFGGTISVKSNRNPEEDLNYMAAYNDNQLEDVFYINPTTKNVIKVASQRIYNPGIGWFCDFCENFKGRRKGTACLANTPANFPPDLNGEWKLNLDPLTAQYYNCRRVKPKNFMPCNELTQRRACNPIGQTSSCFTNEVFNQGEQGEELCKFREVKCEAIPE